MAAYRTGHPFPFTCCSIEPYRAISEAIKKCVQVGVLIDYTIVLYLIYKLNVSTINYTQTEDTQIRRFDVKTFQSVNLNIFGYMFFFF